MFSRDEIYKVGRAAFSAASDGHGREAASLYERALELSWVLQDAECIVQYTLYYGVAELELGNLTKALAIFGSAMEVRGDSHQFAMWRYMILTRIAGAAQEYPLQLGTINNAFLEAEKFLSGIGQKTWRSRILSLQALLAYRRGLVVEALMLAREAWSLAEPESSVPHFPLDSHFKELTLYAIHTRNPAAASLYLDQWKAANCDLPAVSALWRKVRESELLRLQGRFMDSLEPARHARVLLASMDEAEALNPLARAFAVTGEFNLAAECLSRVYRRRRSVSHHYVFEVYLLRGDFHFSRALLQSNLPIIDFEFNVPESHELLTPKSRREAMKALRAYQAAETHGLLIDTRLVVDHNVPKLRSRVRLILESFPEDF